MLIKAKKLAVSPITTHVNLKEVDKRINQNLILTKLNLLTFNTKKFLKKNLK